MTREADESGWIEFSHAGERWMFDADQLASWDEEDGDFHFYAYHGLVNPTVESVIRFIESCQAGAAKIK